MPACSHCGRTMIEIDMATPTAPVTMRSCSTCDRRQWFVDDVETGLDGALSQLATTAKR